MITKYKILFFIFITIAGFKPLSAQEDSKHAVKFEILLKLLSQNKNFNLAEIDTVNLAVIFDSAADESKSNAEMYRQLSMEYPNLPFKGKPLVVTNIAGQNINPAGLKNKHGVIVLPESERFIEPVLSHCSSAKTLSMATDSTFSARGISIIVDYNENSQPEIWFNVTSLNNEGASYDKEILQLVQHLQW